MSEMTPFVFPDTGERMRVVTIEGEPWMVAADACGMLAINNTSDAVRTLDDDEKGVATVDTPGGPQQMAVVNEAGLYHLIFKSRKAEAKAFQRWVFHVVLPEWRKAGAPAQRELSRREIALMIIAQEDALEAAAAQIGQLTELVSTHAPKAEVFDAIVSAPVGGETLRVVSKEFDSIMKEKELRKLLVDKKIIFWTECPTCRAYRGVEVRQYQYYASYGTTPGSTLFALRSTGVLFNNTEYPHEHHTLYVRGAGKIRIRSYILRWNDYQKEIKRMATPEEGGEGSE